MLKNTWVKKLKNEKKRVHKLVALWYFACFQKQLPELFWKMTVLEKSAKAKLPQKNPGWSSFEVKFQVCSLKFLLQNYSTKSMYVGI